MTPARAAQLARAGLILCAAGNSVQVFEKVLHCSPFFAFALGLAGSFVAAVLFFLILPRLSARSCDLLSALVLLSLCVALVTVYPELNAQLPGQGSDRDDALNQTARALMAGRYPYLERTYLGSMITPMPGAILLALPFVLISSCVWQIPVWIAAATLTLRQLYGSRIALAGILCLCFCPGSMRDLLTGGDLQINGLYILILVIACLKSAKPWWPLLLGLSLSSRFTAFAALPVVLVWGAGDFKTRLRNVALALLAFAAITLPFYLWNPAQFMPLHTTHFLENPRALAVVLPLFFFPAAFFVWAHFEMRNRANRQDSL